MAVTDTHIFSVDSTTGDILRVSRFGGQFEVVARGVANGTDLVYSKEDPNSIFFGDKEGGVSRLRIPENTVTVIPGIDLRLEEGSPYIQYVDPDMVVSANELFVAKANTVIAARKSDLSVATREVCPVGDQVGALAQDKDNLYFHCGRDEEHRSTLQLAKSNWTTAVAKPVGRIGRVLFMFIPSDGYAYYLKGAPGNGLSLKLIREVEGLYRLKLDGSGEEKRIAVLPKPSNLVSAALMPSCDFSEHYIYCNQVRIGLPGATHQGQFLRVPRSGGTMTVLRDTAGAEFTSQASLQDGRLYWLEENRAKGEVSALALQVE